ncbi:MAG: hypothetical protein EOL91_10655 [Actinobacteria bacterium]|nr:hypothetical protein [Actinomycetota bacterium]
MEKKEWWKSKTVWSGLVAVLLAAYATAASQFGLPPVPEWMFGILGALGIYSRSVANTVIK